ncbi:ATP-binding cassette domain-containing protein [Bacillus sp. NPDC093026]|uniref:ATP-binding cassette domain-containing protein n=1 Tax=Bacillus sp. NPDC093026 TaxID=3363948 RepID=UPI0038137D3C
MPFRSSQYIFLGFQLDQSILHKTLNQAIRDETVIRTILARLGFRKEDVHKTVGVLSGGERVKAMLAKLLVSDANVLLLDEKTHFLNLAAVEALARLLKDYLGTVVFVSHDCRLIQQVATRIIQALTYLMAHMKSICKRKISLLLHRWKRNVSSLTCSCLRCLAA